MHIAIVGGGIGGLSLAISLASSGSTVEIFEREPAPHVEGAAITLRPLAVKALRRLGVLDRVLEAGRTVDRYRIFTTTGQVFSDLDLTVEGEPTVMILRQELIRVLTECLGGAKLRMGVWPTTVDRSGDTVNTVLSNGEQARWDLLVGADGIRSWVRHQLFPQAETRFVGQHYWRFFCRRRAGRQLVRLLHARWPMLGRASSVAWNDLLRGADRPCRAAASFCRPD